MNTAILGLFAQPLARTTVWARTWQAQLEAFTVEFHESHSYSNDLQVLDSLPQVKQLIEQELNAFSHRVLGIKSQVYITESWINVYAPGQRIHRHSHPNSLVSGTWYWSTPPTCIRFHKQDANANALWTIKPDLDPDIQTSYSLNQVDIPVEENDVLFWPSYMQHSVSEHQDQVARKTLSFNAMPKTWGSPFSRVF